MNMIMLNTQAASVAKPSAAGGTASGKNAADGAFAGALVQAIGGGAGKQAASAAGAPQLAAGFADLTGLIAAVGQDEAASGGDSLTGLLGGLLKLLQGQADGDEANDDTVADGSDAGDALAQLLASLEALLAQLNQQLTPDATNAALAGGDAALAPMAALTGSQEDRLTALLPLLEQLQQAASAPEAVEQPIVNPAQSFGPTVAAIQQQPQRKTVSAFKEPVIYIQQAGDAAPESKPAGEPIPVGAAADTQTAGDRALPYLWTPIGQQAATVNTDAGQAALPAQVPVQQFTEQVGGYLVKQFALSGGEGVVTAKLSLHPDHLGQVDVRIIMQDGQMTAQFVAHNGTAKELIENQMGLLRASLQNQGIQVEKIDVVQQSDAPDQAAFFGQQQRESDSERRSGHSSGQDRDGSYDDPVDFEAEMERTSALRDAGFGSSINVTA